MYIMTKRMLTKTYTCHNNYAKKSVRQNVNAEKRIPTKKYMFCLVYILLRISFAVGYVLWHICSVVSRTQLLWYAILQCTICHNMFSFCSHFVTYSIGFVSFIFVDFEATFFISFCLASFLALRNEIFKRNAAKEACFSAE